MTGSHTYEIAPEPEPDVAAAIVHALAHLAAEERLDDGPDPDGSAWRVAAAHEAVDDGLD